MLERSKQNDSSPRKTLTRLLRLLRTAWCLDFSGSSCGFLRISFVTNRLSTILTRLTLKHRAITTKSSPPLLSSGGQFFRWLFSLCSFSRLWPRDGADGWYFWRFRRRLPSPSSFVFASSLLFSSLLSFSSVHARALERKTILVKSLPKTKISFLFFLSLI